MHNCFEKNATKNASFLLIDDWQLSQEIFNQAGLVVLLFFTVLDVLKRFETRCQGRIDDLFSESKVLQLRLPKASKNNKKEKRRFNRHMHQGKVSCAI